MTITMVKKRLESGEACQKCQQAEELLKRRGLWQRVDRVVWADESDPESPGHALARQHAVERAPFFIVDNEQGTRVYTSALEFAKALNGPARPVPAGETVEVGYRIPEGALQNVPPRDVVRHALVSFGEQCAIAFSGAEDVALIDMAFKSGLPFSIFCIDTGRLHPETYRFIDKVREHYGVQIQLISPEPGPVEQLVHEKGLFSFYQDGHQECCEVRKVSSLRRVLRNYRAWMTGQRRDQSPTRSDLDVVAWDPNHGRGPAKLCKFNPLASWTLKDTWDYLRANNVPTNELHERGFISIGCEPCTRAIRPGEHERAGRWWWEEATKRECGLHVPYVPGRGAGI